MSLRRASLIFAVVIVCIVAGVTSTMIVLTTGLHRAAHEIGEGAEGLRVGEEIEFALVSLRDADSSESRAASEDLLQARLAEAPSYIGDSAERAVFENLSRQTNAYIADRTPSQFAAAFLAARTWARFNLEQSRATKISEHRADRLANFVGGASVVLLVGGLGGLAWWLRRRTFKPALNLAGAIGRYAGGERGARAREDGAEELRTIAHQFNDMATTLEHQREGQLVFLAGVAHDLRNPLGALKLGVASIPPDAPLPPEPRIRQLLARVARQIDRLERMVFDFLDAARIDAGQLELVSEECDVRELVRATAELFETTSPKHELVTTVPDEPVRLTCDPLRIEQVLGNLVLNAIKYSPKGGTVWVTLTDRTELGRVEIAVADQGLGLTPADTEHVFEPFRRSPATKGTAPGVGLGLFVARRIVDAHGGHLIVESSPGVGSTFTVQLPVRR